MAIPDNPDLSDLIEPLYQGRNLVHPGLTINAMPVTCHYGRQNGTPEGTERTSCCSKGAHRTPKCVSGRVSIGFQGNLYPVGPDGFIV